MEKAKIRPLATPKPLNRSSQKLAGVITSRTAPNIQNFVAFGLGGFCSPNTWFCRENRYLPLTWQILIQQLVLPYKRRYIFI